MKKLKVGPVLGLESESLYTVCFSTLLNVIQANIQINGVSIDCQRVGKTPSSSVWRAQYAFPENDDDQMFSYQIFLDSELAECQNSRNQWSVFSPGSEQPPKFVYTSCNGFSSLALMHKTQRPYYLWQKMVEQTHGRTFFLDADGWGSALRR